MKGYNTLYYLLFVILIMGAFASMAQNSYGLIILGGVAIGFAVLFCIQFINSMTKKGKRDVFSAIELCCLFILSVIFAMRVFYISFYYIEWVFGLALLMLVMLYFRKMLNGYRFFKSKNAFLSILVLGFYALILFYFLSLGSIAFLPQLSAIFGISAFVLLVLVSIGGIVKRNILINGENTSVIKAVSRTKDNAILIVSLFLLFTLYKGFTTTGVLPKIYSDEFPQAYFELVSKAESGKEKSVDGKYKYEEYKARYGKFVERNK